eukprot:gene10758-11908_t
MALDLIIAFDSSRSITVDQWTKQINIAEEILNHLNVSDRLTHVGLIDFSNHIHERVTLVKGLSSGVLIAQLQSMRKNYEGGDHTYTDQALEDAMNLFKQSPLSRRAPPVLVLLTDGKVTGFGLNQGVEHVSKLVAELKTMGARIFCITVGNQVDMEALHYIVGAHNQQYIFNSKNFSAKVFVGLLQNVFAQGEKLENIDGKEDYGAGSVCNIRFLRVGCFFDQQKSPRPLGELILTDRDPNHANYSGKAIEWHNWNAYLKDFVCRCARKAMQTHSILFAAQFYGECYAGKDASGYAKDGRALSVNGCITMDKRPCALNTDSKKVCVGRQFHNYVYLLF